MDKKRKPISEEEIKQFAIKLEAFGAALEPRERGILKEIIANTQLGTRGGGEDAEMFALSSFRQASLAALRPFLGGGVNLRPSGDDDGFWARWAERQY